MDAIPPELIPETESGHTTSRKSTYNGRVEILVRADRRRSWTPEQKREIVAESLGPDLTPAEVARKHGISTGQLYTWRRLSGPRPLPDLTPMARPSAEPPSPPRPEGLIEIVLPGGVSLRVDAHVDGRALRRALGAREAGSAVVINGALWHGGTRNVSGRPRRMLHLSFTRRDLPQQLVQQDF